MAVRKLIFEAKDGTPHDTAKAADRHDAEMELQRWIDLATGGGDTDVTKGDLIDDAAKLIDLLKPFVEPKPRKPRAPKAAPTEAAEKPAKK